MVPMLPESFKSGFGWPDIARTLNMHGYRVWI